MRPWCLRIGRFVVGGGRDMARMLPASLFAMWMRPDWQDESRRRFRVDQWFVGASWEWLPRLIRRDAWRGRGRLNSYPAPIWTGRDFEVIGCRWDACAEVTLPGIHRTFHLGRVWGPDWL